MARLITQFVMISKMLGCHYYAISRQKGQTLVLCFLLVLSKVLFPFWLLPNVSELYSYLIFKTFSIPTSKKCVNFGHFPMTVYAFPLNFQRGQEKQSKSNQIDHFTSNSDSTALLFVLLFLDALASLELVMSAGV